MTVGRFLFALSIAGVLSGAPRVGVAQESAAQPPPEGEDIEATAPVTLDGRELFQLRGIHAYPAQQRAAVVSQRILEAARDRSFDPATIDTLSAANATWIGTTSRRILRVHDVDGELEGVDRSSLAESTP